MKTFLFIKICGNISIVFVILKDVIFVLRFLERDDFNNLEIY